MPEPDIDISIAGELNKSDLQLIIDAAHVAGQITLEYFGKDPEVWMKNGSSPVSEADHAADKYLKDVLQAARPDYGWLSEETTDDLRRLECQRVFIVDPIDGTRGFIQGHKKWCVSVAVVDRGEPVCGVLECPALGETYTALSGGGARLNNEEFVAGDPAEHPRISGPDKLLDQYSSTTGKKINKTAFVPSLAYRMAMVATGALDGTYARAKSHDWDIAAVDLVLSEAGARLSNLDGSAIQYNRNTITHGILVAAGDQVYAEMLDAANRISKQ